MRSDQIIQGLENIQGWRLSSFPGQRSSSAWLLFLSGLLTRRATSKLFLPRCFEQLSLVGSDNQAGIYLILQSLRQCLYFTLMITAQLFLLWCCEQVNQQIQETFLHGYLQEEKEWPALATTGKPKQRVKECSHLQGMNKMNFNKENW